MTALLSIPASPSHKDKLEKISNIGIPAEKPKNSIISARRSRNAVKADFHPVDCVVIDLLCSEKLNAAIQTRNALGFNTIYEIIILFYRLKHHGCLNFSNKPVYLKPLSQYFVLDLTVTQRLEQMNASLSANITSNNEQPSQNILTSAFEQAEIQSTLEKTQLKSEQLTHIPNFEKIPASTRRPVS